MGLCCVGYRTIYTQILLLGNNPQIYSKALKVFVIGILGSVSLTRPIKIYIIG